MCIICQWNSGIQKIDLSIKNLYCSDCTSLTSIPYLPNLKVLYCWDCTALASIPQLPKLRVLDCSSCTSLTSIPKLPELETLDCSNCTALSNIPALPNLRELFCGICTNLTTIPILPKLERLCCDQCTILTSVPCHNDMPDIQEVDCEGCKWIELEKGFEENILSLKRCQAIARRKLTARKLESIIPELVSIYYSPGCKGEFDAKRAFSKKI